MYTNVFSFSEQISLDFDTRDVELQFGAAHGIKMVCVQQGFLSKPLA